MKNMISVKNLAAAIASLSVSAVAFAQAATQQVPVAAAQPANAGGAGWVNFALIGGMILFMWLFIIRPQSKRAKEQKEFLASLVPGLEVITAGGIIGTIVEVKDNIVSINVGNSTVRVLKSSISGKLDTASAAVATTK